MKTRGVTSAAVTALLMAELLGGCTATYQQGRPVLLQKLLLIERGRTTEAELLEILGSPTSVQARSSGRKLLLYQSIEGKDRMNPWLYTEKTQVQGIALHVLIEAGRVLDYTVTERKISQDEYDPYKYPPPTVISVPTK